MQIIKVHHDQWSYHFFKVSDWLPHICDSVHTQRTELCCFPVIKPTWHNQNKESTDEEESRKETKTKTKAGSAMWREHQQSCRRNSCYGNAGTAIGSWRLQVQIQRNFSKGQLINISEETGCDENDNVPGQVMLTKKKNPPIIPGWCGSGDRVPSTNQRVPGSSPRSAHMPGLRTRSPVGGVQEATTHWYFSFSFSLPSPLCLKTNKIF